MAEAGGQRPSTEGEPGVVDELEPSLVEGLRHGQAGVMDPRLLAQDGLGVEALVQHAVDDLLTDVCWFRLDLGLLRENLALGRDQLGRYLVARAIRRTTVRDVH